MDHPKGFATLHPLDCGALRVFDRVCLTIQQQPERYGHHGRFIYRNDVQSTVREALGRSISQNTPTFPSLSLSSEGTVADYDNDQLNDIIFTGCYEFSLHVPPPFPKLGWRAGYGAKWDRDIHGRTELLLATREDAKQNDLHGNHLLFNFLADSGTFGVRAVYEDGTTRMGLNVLQKSAHFVPLRDSRQIITIGKLQYELRYNPFDQEGEDKAFQAQKAGYIMKMLETEMPIPHTLVTPSMQDITIGDCKILKTAGAGAQSIIKAAINTHGRLFAVRVLRGGSNTHHDKEVANQRLWTYCLKDIRHNDKVLQLHDVLGPQGGDTRNDVYLLFTPLARGDLYTFVMKDEDISAGVRQTLFAQTVAGVSAVHNARIVHCNISPKNIGVVSLHPPHAIVMDFGNAQYLGSQTDGIEARPGTGGTIGFLAPERELTNSHFGFPSDVRAVGVVGFDLLLHVVRTWARTFNPWREIASFKYKVDLQSLREDIRRYENDYDSLRSHSSTSIEWLLSRMLTTDAEKRISIQEALSHTSIDCALLQDGAGSGKRRAES